MYLKYFYLTLFAIQAYFVFFISADHKSIRYFVFEIESLKAFYISNNFIIQIIRLIVSVSIWNTKFFQSFVINEISEIQNIFMYSEQIQNTKYICVANIVFQIKIFQIHAQPRVYLTWIYTGCLQSLSVPPTFQKLFQKPDIHGIC